MNLAGILMTRMTSDTLERMAFVSAAMETRPDVLKASELDCPFHMILVEAAGNKTLAEIYSMLKPVICRLVEISKSQRTALHGVAAEHFHILSALRRGDGIAFVYHMDRHLDGGLSSHPLWVRNP